MPSPSSSLSWSYIQGLIFIFLVAVIWAGSSILVQHLYTDYEFDSPFCLTFIGSSLFTLWLPVHELPKLIGGGGTGPWWQRLWERITGNTTTTTAVTSSSTIQYHGVDQSSPTRHVDDHEEMRIQQEPHQSAVEKGTVEPFRDEPHDNAQNDDDHHAAGDPPSLTIMPNNHNTTTTLHNSRCWTHADHFRAACWIAPVWFLANWTYNASLAETSITSSTVLASTGSLFTFLFAVCSRDERFGWLKFMGVLCGVVGSCATAWSDVGSDSSGGNTTTNTTNVYDTTITDDTLLDNDDNPHKQRWLLLETAAQHLTSRFLRGSTGHVDPHHENALWGDVLGLLSAVGYGGYAVQTRILCPHNESLYSMQLLLGYIGLTSLITLCPVTLYLIVFRGVRPPWTVVGALVVKGLLDNVLSDYLWLRAVMLTNATVATVGLGMTIPLAFLSDVVWLHKPNVWNFYSVLGATGVLTGFVFVNVGNQQEDDNNNNAGEASANETAIHNHHHTEFRDVGAEDDNEENRMQLRQLD